jgi:hypothetical protein
MLIIEPGRQRKFPNYVTGSGSAAGVVAGACKLPSNTMNLPQRLRQSTRLHYPFLTIRMHSASVFPESRHGHTTANLDVSAAKSPRVRHLSEQSSLKSSTPQIMWNHANPLLREAEVCPMMSRDCRWREFFLCSQLTTLGP